MLDGAFLRNGCNQQKIAARQFGELFYNHNELDLRNGFFREEEVFVWALYKYTAGQLANL
jgi:hypothetical protein